MIQSKRRRTCFHHALPLLVKKREQYVYLFKFPGAQERIGNFNQLVADAQASVWDQSLRIREDLIIQPKIEDEKLILVISDKKTFSELFSQDPTIANCRVRTPYNDINYVSKTRIKVYN